MGFKVSDTTERLKKRFGIISLFFVLALAIVIVGLVFIVVVDGDNYSKATMNRSRSSTVISARRGDIVDCNNVKLAASTTEYNLILDPKEILDSQHDYLDTTAALLQKCFGLSASEVEQKARDNKDSRYVVLLKGLSYSQVKDFMEMLDAKRETVCEFLGLPEDQAGSIEIAGAWLEEYSKRDYIYGTLASSVLGFTQNGTGIYGIEKYYNTELAGTDGRKYTYLGEDNVVENEYHDAQDGNLLQLTMDYNIQSIVEKYMMEMLEETGAKSIAVTIQDPNTGAFLAMADTGQFDPNNPRDLTVRYSDEEIESMNDAETAEVLNNNWKNYCVTETYEPGSTFKAFTVAGALESGAITQQDILYCDGSVGMLDYTIHCAYLDGHGYISVADALAQSCNMAMIDIAKEEGIDTFCKYQSQFGFGSLTDIDLPTEMSCRSLMYTRSTMTDIDLATNSFGQAFNVTMVQMSSAFCSLVNGGTYYKPYMVKGIYSPDGDLLRRVSKTVVSKPVSEETCDFIKYALRLVVTDGTGTYAAVPGYITAGKTGTAEKGKRGEDLWVASFIGFAPYENPEVVCYVVIDEPESGGDGSSAYACQLFSQIMSEVLPYMNVTRADKDYDPTGNGSPEAAVYDPVDYYQDTDEAEYGYTEEYYGNYDYGDGYGDYDYDYGYDYYGEDW
ncbi:MAG: penicillin-binding protein 2 [Parasporobacterium sp.]|nr:penicillin-binding protein 2 [Parasporobacterium sp.]